MGKIAIGILISIVNLHATAGCVALDYQEMKDMKADDLVNEWCEVRLALGKNMDESIEGIGHRSSDSAKAARQNEFDQCMGQSSRIARVLESKGIPKQDLLKMCVARGK